MQCLSNIIKLYVLSVSNSIQVFKTVDHPVQFELNVREESEVKGVHAHSGGICSIIQ